MSEESVKPAVETPPETTPPPTVEVPKSEPKPTETLLGADIAEKAEKPAEAAKVVPEKYELKLPEGSVISQAQVDSLSLVYKEKGLSNEQAQLALEQRSDAVAEFAKGQNTRYEETKSEWLEQCKSDKEFGGDDAKLKESVSLANSVIKKYGNKELREKLDLTGLGNHPELMRMMVKIGREMGPDKIVVAGQLSEDAKPTHQRVWGYMNEEKNK